MSTLCVWCTSYLQGQQLPSTLNKTPYFLTHISFLSVSSHYVAGQQVVHCTCKEYMNILTILGYFPILQYNHLHQL